MSFRQNFRAMLMYAFFTFLNAITTEILTKYPERFLCKSWNHDMEAYPRFVPHIDILDFLKKKKKLR